MIDALFIHADGTREWHEVEPAAEVWQALKRDPQRYFAGALDVHAPCFEIVTFRRELRYYTDNWSGPLESWWRWDTRTVYVRGLPEEIILRFTGETSVARTKRMGLLPTVGLQHWPVEEPIRVEYRFVEEGAPATEAAR